MLKIVQLGNLGVSFQTHHKNRLNLLNLMNVLSDLGDIVCLAYNVSFCGQVIKFLFMLIFLVQIKLINNPDHVLCLFLFHICQNPEKKKTMFLDPGLCWWGPYTVSWLDELSDKAHSKFKLNKCFQSLQFVYI